MSDIKYVSKFKLKQDGTDIEAIVQDATAQSEVRSLANNVNTINLKVSTIQDSVNTNTSDIKTLKTNVQTNTDNISSLQEEMTKIVKTQITYNESTQTISFAQE